MRIFKTLRKIKYAILGGSGAVGSCHGALLQRSGCEVHYLCHTAYKIYQ